MASSEDVSTFLSSPLVKWVSSLVPHITREITWHSLAQGVLFAETLSSLEPGLDLDLDPEPSDTQARAKNLRLILAAIKKFYSDSLNQMLMLPLPSPRELAQIPPSKSSLSGMEDLILLLLGAAVQSDQKQDFIIAIKNLPLEIQHGIVDKIRVVTDNPTMVWNKDLNNPTAMEESQRDTMYQVLVTHAARSVAVAL